MFYYLNGKVALIDNGISVIDCSGVGYAVFTTAYTQSGLKIGENAKLFIHTVIREDCFDLYGFLSLEEKHCFELLIGVSGVGPKAAQSILSVNTPASLSCAVISGDEKSLTSVPGIGKKTAQRILLELKDKLVKDSMINPLNENVTSTGTVGDNSKIADATAALTVLGYNSSEISAAIKGIKIDTMEVQDIIRSALRNLSRKGG